MVQLGQREVYNFFFKDSGGGRKIFLKGVIIQQIGGFVIRGQ